MLMVLSVIFWALAFFWMRLMARRQGFNANPNFVQEYMAPRLLVTFISIVFLVYPDVTQQLLSLFSCQLLDDDAPSNPYYLNLMRPGR
jgi:formate hydrogenlyase subunit 3/multisubunit Na+/H+ antiporter MnhD subunit